MDKQNEIDILLVEDNPNDAELTLRALTMHNMANTVEWVKDGAEALDFLFLRGAYATRSNQKPRLVLLDLRLPKVNGLEVLKAIRANPETEMMPVVVMTSSTEEQDVIASYKNGANSFVSKPVDFDEFMKVVANLGLYWVLINKAPQKGS